MGNIFKGLTRHYNKPRLPQRFRLNDNVPLIQIRAASDPNSPRRRTVSSFLLDRIIFSPPIGQLYNNFEPDAQALLLEKDREIQRADQNHYFVLQQYEKRLKVLEKKVYDLESVSSFQSTLAVTTQLIVLQENKLLECSIQRLRYSQGKEFVFTLYDLVMTLLEAAYRKLEM